MALRVPGSGREVFTELKNRGVEDVFVAVCDGVKGLLEVISTTWEKTVVQQCIAPPDPQQLPLRRPAASGCDRSLAQTGLHGPVRGRSEGPLRRVRGRAGNRYPAIIQLWRNKLGAVSCRSWNTDARDPPGDLHHQRDLYRSTPVTAGREGARALPERVSSAQVPLLGYPVP
jgi:transposase, mutator family